MSGRKCEKRFFPAWSFPMAKRASRRRTSTTIKDQRPTGCEVIAFIEKFLRIPDGPDAGRPLILTPWQWQEVCRIYDNPAGARRAIISTARKNAKTTLCAAVKSLVRPVCARLSEHKTVFERAVARPSRVDV
jgi:phage terminase large subunit-like protein